MKNLTKLLGLTATTVFALSSMQVTAQTGNLTNLLDLVRQDRVAESEDYRSRVQEFEQNANRQQQILDTTKQRYEEQEALQEQLSDTFEANQITIGQKREILRDARGDLNELFGTLQGVAGDFLSTFEDSLISAQYPGRSDAVESFIEKAGSTIEQLNVSEIETFWFYMQQEMTESARVVTYSGEVTLPSDHSNWLV
jgi:biopolymer transport protein ExbB